MRQLLLFLALLLPALGIAEPLRIFVSVPPQKAFAEKVGGDHVEVRVMVRPGHSPATYEPTPKQIEALGKSALYVRIGVPFENAWMSRIRATNPAMRELDARAGIDLRILEGKLAPDPHIWTSPPLVKQMAASIRDTLTVLDPANGENYANNYDAFAIELDALDRDIRALLEGLTNRRFLVFHPAWGYFAATYGLTQIPIEQEGKEPGARTLAELIQQARREKVKVIFVQPQFDEKSARQVARDIGGRVVAIDPLSADYLDNLRRVAQQIAEAAQE